MKNFYALKDEPGFYSLRSLLVDEKSIKDMIYNNNVDKYTPIQPFRIGSEVRLVTKRPRHWNNFGRMDEYLGKKVVVTDFDNRTVVFNVGRGWIFRPNSIAEVIKY